MSEHGGKRDGAGRPPGAPNKATAEVRELALQYGPAAIEELGRLSRNATSEAARVSACNAILERAYGKAAPGRPIVIQLPDTSTADGVKMAMAQIITAAAAGDMTPGEAGDFASLVESQRRALELSDIEARLARLEAAQGARP